MNFYSTLQNIKYKNLIITTFHKSGRFTFGQYIKGQLEEAGVLRVGERITSDTLENYGKNFIEFKKISDNEYIIEF